MASYHPIHSAWPSGLCPYFVVVVDSDYFRKCFSNFLLFSVWLQARVAWSFNPYGFRGTYTIGHSHLKFSDVHTHKTGVSSLFLAASKDSYNPGSWVKPSAIPNFYSTLLCGYLPTSLVVSILGYLCILCCSDLAY
ncbi:hypothetical protein Tco_1428802 [Tanacetum coccineum]